MRKDEITVNQILENAKQRLSSMKFELRFKELLYEKTQDNKHLITIERLQEDIKELENEIKIFIEK